MRIFFLLFLTSCTGLGGFEQFANSVSINQAEGQTEAGCFEAEYTGTWTKSRVSYRKIVIPDNLPEGVEVPSC